MGPENGYLQYHFFTFIYLKSFYTFSVRENVNVVLYTNRLVIKTKYGTYVFSAFRTSKYTYKL